MMNHTAHSSPSLSQLDNNFIFKTPLDLQHASPLLSHAYNLQQSAAADPPIVIDTGASNSCIGFNNNSYFNLNNEKSLVKAAGAGAINMETEIAKNNSIAIGSWKISHFDFVGILFFY